MSIEDQPPAVPETLLEDLAAWTIARALPDAEGEWAQGYEFLRSKLQAWIDERRGVHAGDPPVA